MRYWKECYIVMKRICIMCIVLYLNLCMVSCGIDERADKNDIFENQYQIVKDNLYGKVGEDIKEKLQLYPIQSNDTVGIDEEEAINIYMDFLSGSRKLDNVHIDELTIPTGEEGRRYSTEYAFQDSNDDGISELHINSARYYYVFSFRNGDPYVWKNFTGMDCFPLKDGGFIMWSIGMFKDDLYTYCKYDCTGQEICSVSFSWDDLNDNGIHDEKDEYLFEDTNVTQDQWNNLTREYLYQDEEGVWRITNELDWIILYEGN